MQVSSIELYNTLKNKLGENETKTLIDFIEDEMHKKLNDKVDTLATKDYVRAEITEAKSELKVEIEQVRSELKTEIEQVRKELEKSKADIIKWTFVFIMGQMAVYIALLKIFFDK